MWATWTVDTPEDKLNWILTVFGTDGRGTIDTDGGGNVDVEEIRQSFRS